jgi:hypothetical protein
MAASCLDRVAPPMARVSLAVLTFASRDLIEQCHAFMRYYTQSERVLAKDIFVVHTEVNAELRHCFDKLPKRNVIDLPLGARIPRGLLSSARLLVGGGMGSNSSASKRRHAFTESHKMHALMTMQRELFSAGYTHTLIVDLDELMVANPAQYTSIRDYRATIALEPCSCTPHCHRPAHIPCQCVGTLAGGRRHRRTRTRCRRRR